MTAEQGDLKAVTDTLSRSQALASPLWMFKGVDGLGWNRAILRKEQDSWGNCEQ